MPHNHKQIFKVVNKKPVELIQRTPPKHRCRLEWRTSQEKHGKTHSDTWYEQHEQRFAAVTDAEKLEAWSAHLAFEVVLTAQA
jgi:hypothetical protein